MLNSNLSGWAGCDDNHVLNDNFLPTLVRFAIKSSQRCAFFVLALAACHLPLSPPPLVISLSLRNTVKPMIYILVHYLVLNFNDVILMSRNTFIVCFYLFSVIDN